MSASNVIPFVGPAALADDLYPRLRALRGNNRNGQTDNRDKVVADLWAKQLWDAGWRKKGEK